MDGSFGHFLEIARIQSEVNKLFDVLVKCHTAGGEGAQVWLPNVDVIETEGSVVVRCELPGVSREGLRACAQGTALVISGDKHPDAAPRNAKHHCVERASGPFRRVVHLPPMVNTREARGSLENGVLTITFPKVANRRGEEVVIPIHEEDRVGAV